MKDSELLQRVLAVASPWQVLEVRDDLGERQIDVWVGEAGGRTGWFFGQKAAAADKPERVWRHLNLGGWRCFVHVAGGGAPADPLWCGEPDLPFTRAMAREAAALLWEGVRLQTICALLDVRLDDLWKLKHSLDSGKTGLSAAVPECSPSGCVPDANDPVWESLLDGSLDIDIRVLSLKLLLTRLREQMRLITDTEVRMLKAYEMHRYFVRYEHILAHELAQLRKSSTTPRRGTGT